MNDVNHVIVSGRLTRNPEKRQTPSGASVCDFAIASNRYFSGNQYTTFIKVTLWNKAADYFKDKLAVGDHVFVSGQLFDDNFEQNKDGVSLKTSGRMKIDNARVTIVNKANGEIVEIPSEEMIRETLATGEV